MGVARSLRIKCFMKDWIRTMSKKSKKSKKNMREKPDTSVPLLEPEYLTEGYDPKLVQHGHQPTGEQLDTKGGCQSVESDVSGLPDLCCVGCKRAWQVSWEMIADLQVRVGLLEEKERQRGVDHD